MDLREKTVVAIGEREGVTRYAHIGGFMAGIAVVFTFKRLRAEAISKRPRFLRRGRSLGNRCPISLAASRSRASRSRSISTATSTASPTSMPKTAKI